MNFLTDFSLYWKNYFNFRGRTPRHGYWFVVLWLALIGLVVSILLATLGTSYNYYGLGTYNGFGSFLSIIYGLFCLATIIPSLSLTIRRLHDTGRKWYWLMLPIGYSIASSVIALIAIFSTIGAVISYQKSSDWFGLLGGLGILGIILALVGFVIEIVWIVIMAQQTSPNAIGESTHAGSYAGGYSSPTYPAVGYAPMPVQGARMVVAPSAAASLVGVMGMYKGMSFPVNAGDEIIIGRDSALSHIIITENAQNVSRKHVGIRFDPSQQMYQVFDYSSNGTFKEDGSRLLSNTANYLSRGSIINIGNAQNSFRLN